MHIERTLVDYLADSSFDKFPTIVVDTAKAMILGVLGATIAGARAEGCDVVAEQVRQWGGREEATILIHGGKIPAHNAALVNAVMARSLDYEDSMTQGLHVGASAVPAALASAELSGGCSGKEFLTAVVLGTEIAYRINAALLHEGFDPTGTCSVFAATAVAGRILNLNKEQQHNALGLAFNRSGGSYQSNIEGSLAVELIQGFASQSGVVCAQFARNGITGPKNFLTGPYGYFHLFANGVYDKDTLLGKLGQTFEGTKTHFKKYPTSGPTQAGIEIILDMIEDNGLTPQDTESINIKISPKAHTMVGKPFEVGHNPRVSAQFSLSYCVASALFRKEVKLEHLEENAIKEPLLRGLIDKINILPDPEVGKRDRLALDIEVITKGGGKYTKSVNGPSWFYEGEGRYMTMEEHLSKFQDCLSYSGKAISPANAKELVSMVVNMEQVPDVQALVPLLS